MNSDGSVRRAILATCLVETHLAVLIPTDQEGEQIWREASTLLLQFRSELGHPKPAPQHRPPHGKLDPLLRLATLLSSQPHITDVLSGLCEAARESSGTSDLSWLCCDMTRKLMHSAVNAVWPLGSTDAVRKTSDYYGSVPFCAPSFSACGGRSIFCYVLALSHMLHPAHTQSAWHGHGCLLLNFPHFPLHTSVLQRFALHLPPFFTRCPLLCRTWLRCPGRHTALSTGGRAMSSSPSLRMHFWRQRRRRQQAGRLEWCLRVPGYSGVTAASRHSPATLRRPVRGRGALCPKIHVQVV